MSPRRSSRARSSHLPPTTGGHTNSASSSTSNKPDRNTRSILNGHFRTVSPGTAPTARSDSIDDADSVVRGVNSIDLPPRRSRRGNDSDITKEKDNKLVRVGGDEAEDDEAIEEDVTRCICSQPEYPGPGASVKEQLTTAGTEVL
jgi:hypothetical protein